eukprot:scaffold245795_cov27-Tisochrysis_lutea.AAC.3
MQTHAQIVGALGGRSGQLTGDLGCGGATTRFSGDILSMKERFRERLARAPSFQAETRDTCKPCHDCSVDVTDDFQLVLTFLSQVDWLTPKQMDKIKLYTCEEHVDVDKEQEALTVLEPRGIAAKVVENTAKEQGEEECLTGARAEADLIAHILRRHGGINAMSRLHQAITLADVEELHELTRRSLRLAWVEGFELRVKRGELKPLLAVFRINPACSEVGKRISFIVLLAHETVDEKVCWVVLGRADDSELLKEEQRMECIKDLRSRLMNRGDDGPARMRYFIECGHHTQGSVCVETGSRLVEQDDCRISDHLTTDRDTLALAARDAACCRVANESVGASFKLKHLNDCVDQLTALLAAHRGGEAKGGRESNGLTRGLSLKNQIILHNIRDLPRK